MTRRLPRRGAARFVAAVLRGRLRPPPPAADRRRYDRARHDRWRIVAGDRVATRRARSHRRRAVHVAVTTSWTPGAGAGPKRARASWHRDGSRSFHRAAARSRERAGRASKNVRPANTGTGANAAMRDVPETDHAAPRGSEREIRPRALAAGGRAGCGYAAPGID